MNLLRPWGLLLGLLLPVIFLLYFKKKQILEQQVSSIDLWDEIIRELEGVKQKKIDRILLLLIQLSVGLLIVLALARPIWTGPFQGETITIALDTSISMNAEAGGKTRLDRGKEKLLEYMTTLPDAVKINLLLLKNNSEIALEEADKKTVTDRLKGVGCTYESLNLDRAAQLLSKYATKTVIVSDKDISLGDYMLHMDGSFENIGILDARYDPYAGEVLCRMMNYGNKEQEAVIRISSSDGKQELHRRSVTPKGENTLSFPIDKNTSYMVLQLENIDDLAADNRFILPVGKEYKKKILYIGENFYLKKALESIEDILVEQKDSLTGVPHTYDAYIIEKEIERADIPVNGPAWLLKPPQSLLGDKSSQPLVLQAAESFFTKNLIQQGVQSEAIAFLREDMEHQGILEAEGKPVMVYHQKDGIKRIYSTIDMNKTNFVMLVDFPIFIHRLTEWLLEGYERSYAPGDLIYPVEDKKLELWLGEKKLGDLDRLPLCLEETGIYTLKDQGEKILSFVVNPPGQFVVGEGQPLQRGKEYGKQGVIPLVNMLILLALTFLAVEWEVYRRGY